MALLTGAYDPNAAAQEDFAALPSGKYLAQIVDSDMKPTKKNDGHYLELKYQILEGDCRGRFVWTRLNLDSQNATAVEIANRQFSAIRAATGVPNPTDSVQLHNRPHVIRVEFIPAGTKQKNGYTTDRDGNEVKAWEAVAAGAATQAATTAASPTQQAQAMAAPPWQRNAA